ncbi:uncharacterized protein LOC142161983 [Nicotiana tabacum]|uniref:Uncharacterized protein LOC142161983 n=1 Tax=Nicotiana tabacum TaxID=4097 RepID=A0AC58RNU4_TOBAC
MASDMTVPWQVGGDFNVIWDEEEKYGGLPVSLLEVDDFRHCINTCNLTDLGFKGSIFTWWNGRSEEDCIFKRLDRYFGNNELQQTFPGLEVQAEMIKYLALEEEFWRQKPGMLWFKDGDRNTKFFHAQVNGRRKRQKLSWIQNSLGNWIEEDHLIAEEVVRFYNDQFTESAVPNAFDILNHVPSMVDSDQHERLMALPSNE